MDPEISAEFSEPDAPACPHAAECPGCPLLGLTYAAQGARKLELLSTSITPYPELASLAPEPCVPSTPIYGYRTRAKWVAAGRALGLFARGSHRVLDLPGCLVVDPRIAAATAQLRTLLPDSTLLDGADIALVDDALLITLIGAPGADEASLLSVARRLAELRPQPAGIAVTRRADAAVQLLAGGHQRVHGQSELRARPRPSAPYHYVAFGAFLQANEHVACAIRDDITSSCQALQRAQRPADGLRVLELYAGSGALALSLAAQGMQVTAVESYPPACDLLQRAAREQGLTLQVEQGDAEASVLAHAERGTRFDVVLLNPPRRGLPPALRNAVAALKPARVGYVSCKPSTLARDLAHFARLGLMAERLRPFDMMPHTEQVESLVWLTPAASSVPEVLYDGPALLALNKPPHVPLSPAAPLPWQLAPKHASHRPCYELGPHASGVALLGAPDAPCPQLRRSVFSVLVRGVTHGRGKLQGMRYERDRVVGGHSLLRVEAESAAKLRRACAGVGHPVIGDARADRASAKYFWLRHGLDRAFMHLAEVELGAPAAPVLRAPLAPDLAVVLASLELGRERDDGGD
ncbi:MAG TPA: RsmD family RNA methyltransferase [Polyangiales bacterium]